MGVDMKAVEERFKAYLAGFNSGNLAAITELLHEDLTVFVAPATEPAVSGRATILPSYEKEFASGKKVEATKGPTASDAAGKHGAAAVVEATLLSKVANKTADSPADTKVDVLIYYDANMLQIRHEISNMSTL